MLGEEFAALSASELYFLRLVLQFHELVQVFRHHHLLPKHVCNCGIDLNDPRALPHMDSVLENSDIFPAVPAPDVGLSRIA